MLRAPQLIGTPQGARLVWQPFNQGECLTNGNPAIDCIPDIKSVESKQVGFPFGVLA